MDNKNIKIITLIFLTMILSAVCESIRGIFVPTFQENFNVNDHQIAYIFSIGSIGYILFTYIGGILCEKIGQKKVILLGFICLLTSLTGFYFTHKYIGLLIYMFIMNMGVSLCSIAINTLVPILFISFQALFMNFTHFCYGLGVTITQRTTGILLYRGVQWRNIYLFIAFLYALLTIAFLFAKVPEPQKVVDIEEKEKNALDKSLVFCYMCALGFYVFAESATQNWFVNFMYKVYDLNEKEGSFYIALFFGLFAIGRLIGGFIVDKVGYIKSVLMLITIALILYSTGLIMGRKGLIIISLAGFFFSITFPTIVLTISKVFKEKSAYITGIIITVSSLINMVFNQLIGELNRVLGAYNAFYLVPISLIISIIFIYNIYKKTNKILS
ncbi:MFS transporter [uncultured Clostridium sp.]|uniref:MFS transporter n=1 Tax=uncultured Clostridium sp. TaxID=59620 RepID=UPI0028E2922B|nr:MFS transporter [uncultured Clostridium sp.]